MTNRVLKSIFAPYIQSFISLKCASGYSEKTYENLYNLDEYLYQKECNELCLTKEMIDGYCVQDSVKAKKKSHRFKGLKQFCEYLDSMGIQSYIPNYCYSFHKPKPYVLSHEEVSAFFIGIDEYFETKKCISEHYNMMVPIMFRLMYLCGLRNGETCSLKKQDILYNDRAITIRNAKNNKDRIVYISKEMFEFIIRYIYELDKLDSSEWIFPNHHFNGHINKTMIIHYMKDVLIDLKIGNKSYHPTPHSLRHSYVVHRVDQWIRDGEDIDVLMPYLSAQLGHTSVDETYYYYHMLSTSFRSIHSKSRNLYPEVNDHENQ